MNIFFCDDQEMIVKKYKKIAENYLQDNFGNVDNNVYAVKYGYDLLILTKEIETKGGIYFLDIDLKDEQLDGIKLASEIRRNDPYAEISFISTHDELLVETIKQKINTLNFIFKDDGEDKVTSEIEETIHTGIMHFELKEDRILTEEKYIQIMSNGINKKISERDIYFFERSVSNHHNKVLIILENEIIELSGTLKELETKFPDFMKCHQSFLINKEKVLKVDYDNRKLLFDNGSICDFSYRKTKEIRELFG